MSKNLSFRILGRPAQVIVSHFVLKPSSGLRNKTNFDQSEVNLALKLILKFHFSKKQDKDDLRGLAHVSKC